MTVSGGTTHQFSVTNNVHAGTNGLVIRGGANDVVVFNVTACNVTFQGPVTLTGGIKEDNVLWNVLSSANNNIQSSGNFMTNQVAGDFIDLNGNYNMNEITIDGRLFGCAAGTTCQLVSNGYLNAPPPTVPEPGTLAMMGTGIVGLAWVVRRKLAR